MVDCELQVTNKAGEIGPAYSHERGDDYETILMFTNAGYYAKVRTSSVKVERPDDEVIYIMTRAHTLIGCVCFRKPSTALSSTLFGPCH